MIKKIGDVVAVLAGVGLGVVFAPGFAREIEAGVMSDDKFQATTASANLIAAPEAGCASAPWPYGCDWRTSSDHKKKIARSDRSRRNHRGLTIVRGNGFSADDEL